MNRSLVAAGVLVGAGGLALLARAEGPQAAAPQVGRYQLQPLGGGVVVFDTATGRLYQGKTDRVTVFDPVAARTSERPLEREQSPALTPAPTPVTLDLTSPEATARTVIAAALAGDRDTFRACFTARVLNQIDAKARFEPWFVEWQNELQRKPELRDPARFLKEIKLVQEGQDWKVDEN